MLLVDDAKYWVIVLDWQARWNWIKEAKDRLLAAADGESCLRDDLVVFQHILLDLLFDRRLHRVAHWDCNITHEARQIFQRTGYLAKWCS